MGITEIEQAILDLPDSDFLKLRNWFLELNHEKMIQDDDFCEEDFAESELEWNNYLEGKDHGKSLDTIELELFGGRIE